MRSGLAPLAAWIALAVLASSSPAFGQGDLIFEDGFETGNVSRWSSSTGILVDGEPPELAISAPVGATNSTAPTLWVEYSDEGVGVDLSTLVVQLDGVDVSAACAAQATQAF